MRAPERQAGRARTRRARKDTFIASGVNWSKSLLLSNYYALTSHGRTRDFSAEVAITSPGLVWSFSPAGRPARQAGPARPERLQVRPDACPAGRPDACPAGRPTDRQGSEKRRCKPDSYRRAAVAFPLSLDDRNSGISW